MSAHWALAYFKTEAALRDVFNGTAQAVRDELDDKLHVQDYDDGKGFFDVRCHSPRVVEFDEPPADHLRDLDDPSFVLYPFKNGLYTLWVRSLFSPNDIMMESEPAQRDRIAEQLVRFEATGELAQYWRASNFLAALFPRFFARLSQLLSAEIALVLFTRNPSVDVTAIQFYRKGESVGEYFSRFYEGARHLVEVRGDRAVIQTIFDGRFAFVLKIPCGGEDSESRSRDEEQPYFMAEDFGGTRGETPEPMYAYNHEVSRLYVPFWENLTPFGSISYTRRDPRE